MKSLGAPFDAYKGNEPYIFVSYAHMNSDIVFTHIKKLYNAGFRIWYDEGIDPGTDWSDEIALALNNAACFLVFMSPEAARSHNVKKEIVFAVSKKKYMVCVYIAETELPLGLEMQLGNIQGIPETQFANKNKFYERFMNALPESTKADASVTPAVEQASLSQDKFVVEHGWLKKYIGNENHLIIPETVILISKNAFADNKFIESVIITKNVFKIDAEAFINCPELVSVTIPKTVKFVSSVAFINCPKLKLYCFRDSLENNFETCFGGMDIIYLDQESF